MYEYEVQVEHRVTLYGFALVKVRADSAEQADQLARHQFRASAPIHADQTLNEYLANNTHGAVDIEDCIVTELVALSCLY